MYNPFYGKNSEEEEEKQRKCPFCRQLNPYNSLTCSKCFAYIYPEEEEAAKLMVPEDIRPYNSQAIISLMLGITGVLVCICYPLAIVDSILAIVTGYRAKKFLSVPSAPQKGAKLALWGIILGSLGLTGSIIVAVADLIWKIIRW